MASDLWFREFERQLAEREARVDVPMCAPRCLPCQHREVGPSAYCYKRDEAFRRAYHEATSETDVALRERLADMADRAKKRERGE